jgi:hypothetical protein
MSLPPDDQKSPAKPKLSPKELIAAALADLPPEDQTGLMVLTMAAYIRAAQEAGMTEADTEMSLRILCQPQTRGVVVRG